MSIPLCFWTWGQGSSGGASLRYPSAGGILVTFAVGWVCRHWRINLFAAFSRTIGRTEFPRGKAMNLNLNMPRDISTVQVCICCMGYNRNWPLDCLHVAKMKQWHWLLAVRNRETKIGQIGLGRFPLSNLAWWCSINTTGWWD